MIYYGCSFREEKVNLDHKDIEAKKEIKDEMDLMVFLEDQDQKENLVYMEKKEIVA